MRYTAKLNRRDTPYVISDEVLTLSGGRWEGWPGHDNVDPASIEIYTLPGRQGEKVLNYTTEIRDGAEWKLWLRVFSGADVLYLSYETTGDVVEADDVNQLQGDLEELAADTEADRRAGKAHREDRDNPHGVTKEQLGLGSVDDTPDTEKPVSAAQGAAIEAVRQEAQAHGARTDNPHAVTKGQVGLGHVLDVPQAAQADFLAHVGDGTAHLTAAERQVLADKYTRNEIDNKFSALETATDWKESVDTFADLETTYPAPEDGWTVNIRDSNITYRWDGTRWIAISANAIPKATAELDGLLAKEDKAALDAAAAAKHVHENKGVLDGITASLVEAWNRVTGKVDKVEGKGLSANDYTDAEKQKLAGVEEGANKYVHPGSGTNPHGTTAADVGLGRVPNVDTDDQTPTFTQAASRVNLVSGEKLSVLFGKIMRWLTDLKAVAFSGSYNDLSDKPVIPGAPTELPPSGPAGGDLEGSYPNPGVKDNSHLHTIANVTGLDTALKGKADAEHTHTGYLPTTGVTWNDLKGGGGG